MDIFSTAIVVFFTCLNGAILFLSYREARAAEAAEARIEKTLARVAGLTARVSAVEASFESLRLQHQKLHGKFHARMRELEAEAEERQPLLNAHDVAEEEDFRVSEQLANAPYCTNYAAAQLEGPFSDAAACNCIYCSGRRDARAALREKARALPSHAATVRAIKDNS